MRDLLGVVFDNAISNMPSPYNEWLGPIATFLDGLLVPLTIIVAVAGGIWVVILGVNLARAETSDKAQEAKKRLINVAVAMVCVIVFMWLLTWFASSIGTIFTSNPLEQ